MLDDDGGGMAEFRREASRRFQVDVIVIGKLFSLELFGSCKATWGGPGRNIERRGLMRVLAVAQRLLHLQPDVQTFGQNGLLA